MIKQPNSWWGIKNTGEDITSQMLDIINNAQEFIIVGGYNFTFKTSAGARPFFDALVQRLRAGVEVLMMFPPRLHGKFNPQPKIIHYCLSQGIAVILNHQNHSKWLLTESQIYYGSSNFTDASWRDRVEVVSMHDHTHINAWWSQETIKDFKDFLDKEIKDLTAKQRRMITYRGLLTSTRNSWSRIKPLIKRLNPSIEKVVETQANYDEVLAILQEQVCEWFYYYNEDNFLTIFDLSKDILNAIDQLYEYAYTAIYNESVVSDYRDVPDSTVNVYNDLHSQIIKTIDQSIVNLPDLPDYNLTQGDLGQVNIRRIDKIDYLLKRSN